MIELFDSERLLVRRDHSAALAAGVLALAAGVLAVHAATLQRDLQREQARRGTLENQLRAVPQRPPVSAALLADLQRQVLAAEADLAAFGPAAVASAGGSSSAAPAPSAWLDRLSALGSTEVSLARIEIDALGGTRIEGLATSPQAVSGFVQAFSQAAAHHDAQATAGGVLPTPRAVEVRQDKTQAAHLRFQLRAAPSAAPSNSTAAAAPDATTPKGRS